MSNNNFDLGEMFENSQKAQKCFKNTHRILPSM